MATAIMPGTPRVGRGDGRQQIVELNFDEFVAHLQNNHPAPSCCFSPTSRNQLSAAYDQIQTLSFSSTMERLVRTLGQLADEFGEPDGEWVQLTHYFRQDDLAQMIGARREVVSTLLDQLRDRGLINCARKTGCCCIVSGSRISGFRRKVSCQSQRLTLLRPRFSPQCYPANLQN
ncbi:MAG: Crp/Fnr family transcriptional regulator [Nitrospira sp.]|nr:Crp/Fnr family transcriptional regulator [Nitrospira sp.]